MAKNTKIVKHNKPTANRFVYAGYSKIEGRGLFAREDIAAGTLLCEYAGPEIPKEAGKTLAQEGNRYIFSSDRRTCIDGSVSWNLARYANHSCRPNAEAVKISGKIWLKAVKEIKKGEEITYDYGYSFKNFTENPCNCGMPGCLGYIVPQRYRKKLKI